VSDNVKSFSKKKLKYSPYQPIKLQNENPKYTHVCTFAMSQRKTSVWYAIINRGLSGQRKLLHVRAVSTDFCMCVCVSLPHLSLRLWEYTSVLCKWDDRFSLMHFNVMCTFILFFHVLLVN